MRRHVSLRRRGRVLLALCACVAAAGTFVLSAARTDNFPHAAHARMFPLCTGCHAAIETGDSAGLFPSPQLCARCHDGVIEPRVDWSGPARHLSNLQFTHPAHDRVVVRAGDPPLECAQCHTPAGAPRMSVVRADPPVCLSCHGHRADDHFVDAPCATCHVPFAAAQRTPARLDTLPLPEDHRAPRFAAAPHGIAAGRDVTRCAVCHTRESCASCHINAADVPEIARMPQAPPQWQLPPSRLATLPLPDDHRAPDFIAAAHGAEAQRNSTRCTVCHTRERCTSCHVNAADVPEIARVPLAPPHWQLPRYQTEYPVPPSHLERGWIEEHGVDASRSACAACHTREDCTACHSAAALPVIAQLPSRTEVAAPGVVTERKQPPSHASRFFETQHAALAASAPQSCNACHTTNFCADCHEAPAQPTYHPRNFSAQHSSASYGRRLECATCHETQTFCRSCHGQQGMQAEGRLNPGFHDAEPLWLLRHARAARQGLESCTSCHKQKDCMQCHSQLGAFRVNPHGPDFDARRAQKRNPVICFACHVADPLSGGGRP